MATIEEARQLIATADLCGLVPLLRGAHGIGKSESSAQHAAENNMHYEPLILSLMDTGDMLGIPDTVNVGGMPTTIWASPDWYTNIVNAAWPTELKLERLQFSDTNLQQYVMQNSSESTVITRTELNALYCEYYELVNDRLRILRQNNVEFLDAKRSLLNLDEFNRTHPDILNACLQLILDHRLHSHVLPLVRGQETLIVAAVNPSGENYTVQEFDPALLDRFVECDVEADFPTWKRYAKKKNLAPVVIDFISDNLDRFHWSPKDNSKGTSPRTWTRVAKYVERLENGETDRSAMPLFLKGLVGSAVAAQFLMYYNSYGDGLTSEEIEKSIKKEITKAKKAGEDINPMTLSEKFAELIEKVDAMKRVDFADSFISKYIEKDTAAEAMPMLVYLYSLPLENLSAVLKRVQADNSVHYANLAKLDKEFGKQLFLKVVSYRKAT